MYCGNPGESMSTTTDGHHINKELVGAATQETSADLSFDPSLTANSKDC